MKKNAFAVTAVMLALIIAALGILPAASLAEGKNNTVKLTVSLVENWVCARYSVNVYMDGQRLFTLQQGEQGDITLRMDAGKHLLEFRCPNEGTESAAYQLEVQEGTMNASFEVQTHYQYVHINQAVREYMRNGKLVDRIVEDSPQAVDPDKAWGLVGTLAEKALVVVVTAVVGAMLNGK